MPKTMPNNRFKLGSATSACRHCGRRTRDTNGDNGDLELCEDCHEGLMWENGGNDTDDTTKKAECYAKSDAHFQRAIAKGGVITPRA